VQQMAPYARGEFWQLDVYRSTVSTTYWNTIGRVRLRNTSAWSGTRTV